MLIVSDASPVIALAVCDKLDLLDKLFDRVCIPQAVFNELAVPDKPKASKIMVLKLLEQQVFCYQPNRKGLSH